MSDVQIAVIDQQDTQIVLAVPGVQGATGSSIPSGGTVDQVLRKNSSTDYDAGWTQVTSAMIANGTIVDEDVNNGAAIAGTKISPDFGGQAVSTTAQVNAARVNVTANTEPTNGIYLPASNTVGISTNGTGRLFVGSTGQIGINQSALTTGGFTGGTLKIGHAPGTTAGILLQNNSTNADSSFWYTDGTDSFLGSNNGAFMHYAGGSERLRITSTGTVNIVGAGTAGSTQAISFNGSAPVNSLVIDSSGRVGLGTSSIRGSSLLDARGDISFGSNASYYGLLSYNAGTGHIETTSSDGGFKWIRASGSVTSMTLDSSGRLGVGTTTPGGKLVISDGSTTFQFDPVGGTGNILRSLTSGGSRDSLLFDATQYVYSNGATEYARIDSSGRLGLGTSTVSELLHIKGGTSTSLDPTILIANGAPATSETASIDFGFNTQASDPDVLGRISSTITNRTTGAQASTLSFGVASAGSLSTKMTLTGTGLGVGTTSPSTALDVSGELTFSAGGAGWRTAAIKGIDEGGSFRGGMAFYTHPTAGAAGAPEERARIDSSGRLLVGTSSARANFENSTVTTQAQIEGTGTTTSSLGLISNAGTAGGNGPFVYFARSKGSSIGSNDLVADGDHLGGIAFQGNDGSEFVLGATIRGEVDGTPGANDMPGRLVFSTTADGASSPTERMRITNAGHVFLASAAGTTIYPGENNTANGFMVEGPNGKTFISTASVSSLSLNRNVDDGVIVSIRQAGTEEGSISVSGTTVSYNGAHLSRWSQLPGGTERTEILRGSVLSNIDEMCEWGEEENEQLNRMKVSDVEGDKNVSGVFQCWDDDDDTYTNDFYCAMTGDFIIRIGAGVTVERGDLLMSAGDGTAKPQDDDIIRSKTIAKVTSTNVSCTYDDGSYCVPCVLMVC